MSIADIPTDDYAVDDNLKVFARESGHLAEEKPIFAAITMKELMSADYSVNFLCSGVLAEGQPAIFGGSHKTFKTTLALLLGVCLATGIEFLSHFTVPNPVKVCFFSIPQIGKGFYLVLGETTRCRKPFILFC